MDIKIKLKIKDVEIELDRKELKELINILGELFPKEIEYRYYPNYYPNHYPLTWRYYTIPNSTTYGTEYKTKPIWTTTSDGVGSYTIAHNNTLT